MVERAQIILGCLAGKRVIEVARACHTRSNTVIKWRQRFVQQGLAGLRDAPRPGAQRVYGEDFRKRVLALLEQPPPTGQASWDGPAVAARLQGSVHAVWRVLRQQGICLQRQRSWCVSTDKEFAAKAADIVGLYLDCVWQLLLAHFGGLIWPTLGRCRLGKAFASPSRKNKDRRRSCGNVGIPPLWRDFQGRWEEWETVLGFSTLSTARHFHS